jgi:hypothetical protein
MIGGLKSGRVTHRTDQRPETRDQRALFDNQSFNTDSIPFRSGKGRQCRGSYGNTVSNSRGEANEPSYTVWHDNSATRLGDSQ